MTNTKRILFIITIFIGGALFFAFWAINNFNVEISNIEKLSESNITHQVSQNKEDVGTTTENVLASAISTSSNEIIQDIKLDTGEPNFKFSFPTTTIDVYKGCKYKIFWTSAININSISLSLIDAGNKKLIGPVVSGIPKNISDKNSQSLEWKVGNIWPGKYYILVSEINEKSLIEKSSIINVNEIPDGSDIKNICNK